MGHGRENEAMALGEGLKDPGVKHEPCVSNVQIVPPSLLSRMRDDEMSAHYGVSATGMTAAIRKDRGLCVECGVATPDRSYVAGDEAAAAAAKDWTKHADDLCAACRQRLDAEWLADLPYIDGAGVDERTYGEYDGGEEYHAQMTSEARFSPTAESADYFESVYDEFFKDANAAIAHGWASVRRFK